MIIDEEKFPILSCIESNILTNNIFDMLNNSGFEEDVINEIRPSFDFFTNRKLEINYISSEIHEKLIDTSYFIKGKSLLKISRETTGLLLLPKIIYPDFSNLTDYLTVDNCDYPINAIFYSWLTMDNHAKIAGTLEEGQEWGNDNDRELLIIPVCDDRITQATRQLELINSDEIFGWDYNVNEGRAWYGKIHDYIMSFILFSNFMESETHTVNAIRITPKQTKTIINQLDKAEIFNKVIVFKSTNIESIYSLKFKLLRKSK